VYGPVRTVVWEGWSRKAPPYPDPWDVSDMPTTLSDVRFWGVRRKTSAPREYFAFDRLSKKSFCIAYHKFSEPQAQRSYKRVGAGINLDLDFGPS